MAITLSRQVVRVSIASVVSNAMTSIRATRMKEAARKESEFQRAVANGMSYDAQVKYRQKQIEDEQASQFSDPDYLDTLKTSLATTKQMARFDKIRTKYKSVLDEYVTGKGSFDSYISTLEQSMADEQDPQMRAELQRELSQAYSDRTTMEKNAITNRATVAEKDRSIELVDKSIREIEDRRALAGITGNDEEISMWDDTLLSLRSHKSKIVVENGLNDISYKITKDNLKSNQKIGLINQYIGSADASTPVTYDGVTYTSMKAFWESKRNDYIAGAYFDDLDKEITAETQKIAQTSQFGQIPVARIQMVREFYDNLKGSSGFAPYVDQIEQRKTSFTSAVATDLAESLYNEAQEAIRTGRDPNSVIQETQNRVMDLENKFGVKLSRQAFQSEADAGKTISSTVKTGLDTVKPSDANARPTATSTPEQIADYVVRTGATNLQQQDWWKSLGMEKRTAAYALVEQRNKQQGADTTVPASVPTAKPAATPVTKNTPSQPAPSSSTLQTPQEPGGTTTVTQQPGVPAGKRAYVVQAGDTISSIARKQLGSPTRFREVQDPKGMRVNLTPGATIYIPQQ